MIAPSPGVVAYRTKLAEPKSEGLAFHTLLASASSSIFVDDRLSVEVIQR